MPDDTPPDAVAAASTESSDPAPSPGTPWWTTYTLEVGTGGRWRMGPTTLYLLHTRREWRVFHDATGDVLDATSTADVPLDAQSVLDATGADADADPSDSPFTVTRHGVQSTGTSVEFRPALADRPVVVRPEHALSVPAGEAITLYVSTPLCVQIHLGETTLQDVSTQRLSDTWFGPSTREGELCYAAKTAGRLELENLLKRKHRAITPVRVHNRGTDALPVERVQVPTPYLQLYEAPSGFLWTQMLTMTREKGDAGAPVEIADGPPEDVPDATPRSEPRQKLRSNLVVSTFRTLGSLFGQ